MEERDVKKKKKNRYSKSKYTLSSRLRSFTNLKMLPSFSVGKVSEKISFLLPSKSKK